MAKKISRIIGALMLLIAVVFIVVALNNPQASFPWSNAVTYGIYVIYFIITVFFLIAPFGKKN